MPLKLTAGTVGAAMVGGAPVVSAVAAAVMPMTAAAATPPAIFSGRLERLGGSAATTPAGLKPAGTGGTSGAPAGTVTTIGASTDARPAVSHSPAAPMRARYGPAVTASADGRVRTTRYSISPVARAG